MENQSRSDRVGARTAYPRVKFIVRLILMRLSFMRFFGSKQEINQREETVKQILIVGDLCNRYPVASKVSDMELVPDIRSKRTSQSQYEEDEGEKVHAIV